MYRILVAASKKDNYGTLYKYMVSTVNGSVSPAEFETRADIDKKVEDMLNNKGYSKSDFIIVEELDYSIDADIVKNGSSGSDSGETATIDESELDAMLKEVLV